MIQGGFKRLALPLLAIVLVGCTTIEDIVSPDTRVDYKKNYDFEHIETLAIAPVGYSEGERDMLSTEQVDSINLAITRALESQGMDVVEQLEDADAVVDWHVITSEASSVRAYNAESYYQCWRCGPAISGREVTTQTVGTFIVDVIDPQLRKSVWRGLVQGRLADLEGVSLDQAQVDAAAREIFSRFPPRLFPVGPF